MKKQKLEENVDRVEKALKPLRQSMESWDWDLAGGAWPIDPSTLGDLIDLGEALETVVLTGVPHGMSDPQKVWQKYRWRRVYDDDGRKNTSSVSVSVVFCELVSPLSLQYGGNQS